MGRLAAVAGAAAALVVLLALATRPARDAATDAVDGPETAPPHEPVSAGRALESTRALARAPSVDGPRRRPASLRGTEVDGALVIDASGRFVVGRDAIELFDYFFVARGEESDEEIVARIVAEIEARLDPPASAAALDLLDRYLDYRHRVAALATSGSADPADAFEELVALRREVFGADADVLFAHEEARTRIALAQREIAGDPSLGHAERRELTEALWAELPEPERRARERATAPARWLRDEAALRQAGASDEEMEAIRADRFGADAARRLAELERRRAAWDARLEEFRAARDAILADASLTAEQRSAAVEDLLDARFEGPERLRVEALDRIARD